MDYNTITEFYNFVEHNISNPRRQSDITRDLKQLADSVSDDETKLKLQWEMLVFPPIPITEFRQK